MDPPKAPEIKLFEAIRRGGVHFICPICLEKKRQQDPDVKFNSCCGQEVCKKCIDKHELECTEKGEAKTCAGCW